MTETEKKELQAKRVEIVKRLDALDLSVYEGSSHGRLSVICEVVSEPNCGWTLGACEVLRERLIYLLGGDGDGDASEDDGPAVPCAASRTGRDECHQQPTKDVDPDVMSLSVRTFELGTPKDVATKLLEEAAEAFATWQMIDGCGSPSQCAACEVREHCEEPLRLADELADVVQVVCNLAARYGIDMGAAMKRCEQRQRERGRL